MGARSTGVAFEKLELGEDQQLGLNDGSGVRWLDYKLSVRKSNDRDKESPGDSSNAYTGCTSISSLAMSSSNAFNFRIE